ncbi:MAG: hypothetical protein ACRDDY_13820 [Clostridium sp.]|uniref:hypothetical protein n=1 Tax=Clostridium sp. TaxID=1506 RepID=UPI003EE721C7
MSDELPNALLDSIGVEDARKRSKENVRIASGRGEGEAATAGLFSGFNHRNAPIDLPRNTDRIGYTFFTRTDVNFDLNNIKRSRFLTEALRAGHSSYTAAIMAMLDPQCGIFSQMKDTYGGPDRPNQAFMPEGEYGMVGGKIHNEVGFDNKCAFIPMLSNLLVSLSGFPDSSLDVYRTEEGIMREQRSYPDSTRNTNGAITLSATFSNIAGDPVSVLFNMLIDYIARVKDGTFLPRWENMLQRRADYEMRVYRLLTDTTGRYVTKYGIGNAMFPLNDTMGAFMNVPNANNGIIADIDQLNVTFECNVTSYNDPIIKQEFNEVVTMFNPDMIRASSSNAAFKPRSDKLIKLDGAARIYCNTHGYPHLDVNTNELSWWEYSDVIDRLKGRSADPVEKQAVNTFTGIPGYVLPPVGEDGLVPLEPWIPF